MRPVPKKYKMHFGFNKLYPDNLKYLTNDGKHNVDYIINICYNIIKRYLICLKMMLKEQQSGIEKIKIDVKLFLINIIKNIKKEMEKDKDLEHIGKTSLKEISIFVKDVYNVLQKINLWFTIKMVMVEIQKKLIMIYQIYRLFVNHVISNFIIKELKIQRKKIMLVENHVIFALGDI